MYTLIVSNEQGATNETNHKIGYDVYDQIRTWADPQNLTAVIYRNGERLFEGPAVEYLPDPFDATLALLEED